MRAPARQAGERPLEGGRPGLTRPLRRPLPLKLFFDGGCRPNPGKMEAAVVARGMTHGPYDLGPGSSEEAEWRALLAALDVAADLGAADILLLGDSASVIDRAKAKRACRNPAIEPLRQAFIERSALFETVRLRPIRRTQNLAGIALDRHHPR